MNRNPLINQQRGVLLLELSIAMFIIGVALLGLMEGYRASTDANAHYDRIANLQLLADQKIVEIAEQGQFNAGRQEGVFQQNTDVHWETETAETEIPNLYKIDFELSHYADSLRLILFLRQKKEQ